MRLIGFLLGRSTGKVFIAVLAGIIAGVSNTGLLALINTALNDGSGASLAWSFAGLCVLMLACRVTSEVLLVRLSLRAISDLRIDLARRILGAPLRHLEELGPHRLLATLTEDAPVIVNALTTLPVVCMNVAVVITCLIYLGWLSWTVLLGVFGFLAVGVATYQLPLTKAMHYLHLSRDEWDALFKQFRSLTEGIKELKLHQGRQNSFITKVLQAASDSFIKYNALGHTIYSVASGWGHLLLFLLVGALVFLAPSILNIDRLALVGYSIVILYMMTPLEVIIGALPIFGRADVALRKIEKLGLSLAERTKEGSAATSRDSQPSWDSVELVGVTHAYRRDGEDDQFILGPIDMSLRPGELVFITGANGSGKTTLAKLLTGLYVPESGEIRLNGRVVDDATRNHYRQHFSALFSDFYLFEQLLGLEAPDLDEKVRDYLIKLQIQNKVSVKAGEFSTTELSQGQRKRLALLTAYLEDRPIYLFDEWAADQDPLFKEVFYYQILPDLKLRGKTALVITHDDRYYKAADRLIKLDYGKIERDVQVVNPKPTAEMPATVA